MAPGQNRVRYNTRDPAPCMGCTERFTACSSRCPKDARGEYGYDAWKKNADQVKKNRKDYNDLLRTYLTHRRNRWQR